MQPNATHRIEYSNKLTVQGEFREFDVRCISLSYTLDIEHTVTLSSYDDRVLHCISLNSILRNAECGIRTTYNLRNIPHQNFRKIYVIEIPHSAKHEASLAEIPPSH